MKKILVTTLVACALVSSALAQGLITFSASTGNLIRYTTDGTTVVNVPSGNPAQVPGFGNFNLALYGAPVGTTLSLVGGVPDLTGWTKATPVLQQIGPAQGGMTGKIVDLASVVNAAGNLQLTVVAWTGSATDFKTAAASTSPVLLGWTGSTLSGGALSWQSGSGTATTPYVIAKGADAYNGLVLAPIPEPTIFALAGLGAAALLIFRRRN